MKDGGVCATLADAACATGDRAAKWCSLGQADGQRERSGHEFSGASLAPPAGVFSNGCPSVGAGVENETVKVVHGLTF